MRRNIKFNNYNKYIKRKLVSFKRTLEILTSHISQLELT